MDKDDKIFILRHMTPPLIPPSDLSQEFEEALRRVSFSSIASYDTRNTYISALDTLRKATFPHLLLSSNQSSSLLPSSMDSPSDLSPNAPPSQIHPHQYLDENHEDIINTEPGSDGCASSNDSEISSGFEKVDPNSDLLADYSANFHNQMQQSLYGQFPEDPSARSGGVDLIGMEIDEELFIRSQQSENSFEVIGKNDIIDTLSPSFGDIHQKEKLSEPMDDILEKSYDNVHHPEHEQPQPHHERLVDDLIGQLAETEGAQAIDKAVHEAPKVVDDLLHKAEETIEEKKPDEIKLDDDIVDYLLNKPHDLPAELPKEEHVDIPSNEPISPSEDSGRDTVGKLVGDISDDDEPHFGEQTPEETTFDRQGPLTFPQLSEKDEIEEESMVPPQVQSDHYHGFDTIARPPTPPKDISDEDVKPSTVQLGHHEPHHDQHRSILKSSSSYHGRGPWIDFKTIDPRVLDIIYWRDPKKSGIALAAILALLYVLTRFPLITVVSYSALALLTGTVGFRVIKAVEAQIKKTDGSNPFQPYLEQDLTIPQDRVHEQVDVIVEHGQCLARQLRRLFLVENIVDSVKFGLLLWSFTYIGAWFSGCTLAFLSVLSIFSIPKIYETYQEPIDAHLEVIKGHIDNVTNIIEEKLPFLKRAVVEVEKKEQ